MHYTKKEGKLILISSTLFLSKNLFSGKSSLLGLFAEIPMGLISLQDTLRALANFKFPKKEKLELAILLREPIAIDYFDEKKSVREIIAGIVLSSLKTIPALVGEIFLEEERKMSAVYEGILRSIAIGKIDSGEISSYLFSKKIIKKDDPSIIQQYLNNLVSFGVIKRIEIFNKKSVVEAKDFDIDGCLLRFNKPDIVLEVKWKKIGKKDILKSEETINKIDAPKKFLFVQDKKGIKSNLKVIDVDELFKQL